MDGNFRSLCLKMVCRIPKGRVTTYKIIAGQLNTRAYRAVGRAMASNENYPHIPCHRVIRNDGKIGNYTPPGGIKRKRELLKKEGVMVKNGAVENLKEVIYRYD